MTGLKKAGGASARVGHSLIVLPATGQTSVVPYGDDIPSWLWVGDAARSVALAATSTHLKSRRLNVAGDNRSIREAVEIVRKLIPEADITVEPGRFGFEHPLDTRMIEQELGFRWEWDLERQLAELIERARREYASARA
jgi:nucleoside-diphosphate-sugar epimerase